MRVDGAVPSNRFGDTDWVTMRGTVLKTETGQKEKLA